MIDLYVTANLQENKIIFLTADYFLKREYITIELHALLSKNHTRVSCFNASTSSR